MFVPFINEEILIFCYIYDPVRVGAGAYG